MCQHSQKMLKTLGFTLGFYHLHRDVVNVNAYKAVFDPSVKSCPFKKWVCLNRSVLFKYNYNNIWASMWENLSLAFANNKVADQPVPPHSLISTFVIRLFKK